MAGRQARGAPGATLRVRHGELDQDDADALELLGRIARALLTSGVVVSVTVRHEHDVTEWTFQGRADRRAVDRTVDGMVSLASGRGWAATRA